MVRYPNSFPGSLRKGVETRTISGCGPPPLYNFIQDADMIQRTPSSAIPHLKSKLLSTTLEFVVEGNYVTKRAEMSVPCIPALRWARG